MKSILTTLIISFLHLSLFSQINEKDIFFSIKKNKITSFDCLGEYKIAGINNEAMILFGPDNVIKDTLNITNYDLTLLNDSTFFVVTEFFLTKIAIKKSEFVVIFSYLLDSDFFLNKLSFGFIYENNIIGHKQYVEPFSKLEIYNTNIENSKVYEKTWQGGSLKIKKGTKLDFMTIIDGLKIKKTIPDYLSGVRKSKNVFQIVKYSVQDNNLIVYDAFAATMYKFNQNMDIISCKKNPEIPETETWLYFYDYKNFSVYFLRYNTLQNKHKLYRLGQDNELTYITDLNHSIECIYDNKIFWIEKDIIDKKYYNIKQFDIVDQSNNKGRLMLEEIIVKPANK
jgi:hypothetical protein